MNWLRRFLPSSKLSGHGSPECSDKTFGEIVIEKRDESGYKALHKINRPRRTPSLPLRGRMNRSRQTRESYDRVMSTAAKEREKQAKMKALRKELDRRSGIS